MTTRKCRQVAAHYVLTHRGLLRGGIVTIDPEGFVTSVDCDPQPDRLAGVEFYSGILIPGMVNAHAHLELSYLKDTIEPGRGFTAFAAGISANRNRFSQQERLAAANYHDAYMWSRGVSAVGDICNSFLTFPIKTKSPVIYHSFVESYGLAGEPTSSALELLATAKQYGIRSSMTPHSTYSLNDRHFVEAIGDGIGPLSVHFMESPAEKELFRGEGDFVRWYSEAGFKTDFTERYNSPVGRIIANIPPSANLLLVHNTEITREEILRLIGHYGDNLTFVVCPRSNDFINGRTPPVKMLLDCGAKVAVGTDSLASNTSLDLIEELKVMNDLTLEQSLQCVTEIGAAALGLDNELGSFGIGKRPGVVLLENLELSDMRFSPLTSSRRLL